jgi:hypothetical protein
LLPTSQDLRAKLLAEAEAAAGANSTISGRWSGVLSHNVLQDMFNAIEQQRLACEAVIASKDRLIAGRVCGMRRCQWQQQQHWLRALAALV